MGGGWNRVRGNDRVMGKKEGRTEEEKMEDY